MTTPQANNIEPAAARAGAAQTMVYDSSQLFEAGKEILIHHAGQLYRLSMTRHNKLILTK